MENEKTPIYEVISLVVEDLDPLSDAVFVSFLKDNRIFKPYKEAYCSEEAEKDREKWNLRIKYPEQYISGAFLWKKAFKGIHFWTKYNEIWRKLSSLYRSVTLESNLNEERQTTE